MRNALLEFLADESAASAVEYAILGSLVAAVIAGAVALLGQKLPGPFATVSAQLP